MKRYNDPVATIIGIGFDIIAAIWYLVGLWFFVETMKTPDLRLLTMALAWYLVPLSSYCVGRFLAR